MLVKGGVGGQQITFLDIGHMFFSTDEDAMFLYAFDTFLNSTIHLRVDGASRLIGTQKLRWQESSVIVDGILVQFLQTGLKAFVTIPPNVIVARCIMVLHIGPLSLLG